jgi:hypothetical protein
MRSRKKNLLIAGIIKLMLTLSFLTVTIEKTRAQTLIDTNAEKTIMGQLSRKPEEKLYLHVAKNFYLPGEIIWFKAYIADAVLNKPLPISKVAYIELLDNNNKPVLQTKIAIDSASGNGSLVVPGYLSSGNYVLRGYTNLMKNYSPEYFFHQFITILNPAKVTQPLATRQRTVYANFYPEGGNLVNGLQSTVAFEVKDSYGKGINASGVVVNQTGDTLVRFNTQKFGMGRFSLTPKTSERYRVLISTAINSSADFELAPVLDRGYVVRLQENENKTALTIEVHSNKSQEKQKVFLALLAKKQLKLYVHQDLLEGKSTFNIGVDKIPEGISDFIILDERYRPVAERLYFRRPAKTLDIKLATDKEKYEKRSRISTTIETIGNSGTSDLSVAVFQVDSLEIPVQNNIRNYFWLTSELRGNIESPDYYFSAEDREVNEVTDNLMLVHGWRRIIESPEPNSGQFYNYLPELSGHLITGKVIDKRSDLPAKGIITYLSVPGERFHFSSCRSSEDGSVIFDCRKIFGTENIIVQTNRESDSVYRIEIDNPFPETYNPFFKASSIYIPDTWKQVLQWRITNAQIQNAFAYTAKQQFYLPDYSDTTAFFGKPDKTYFLDDYTRFGTMEEVMREYVSEVQVRRSQNSFRYKMFNIPFKLFFDNNPLVLLDGVPVFDINRIISLDPLKVKKLDLVPRRYFQGSVSYEGIASYSTYSGDLAGFELDPNALIIQYAGLQLQRQFYAPVYETEQQVNNRLPDFRNLLYWNPNIKTNYLGKQEISFFSSDINGSYAIVIQGNTADGTAGYSVKTFTVGNN